MRTFCILTQDARDDAFCDGVFEDGMRVRHDGRLTSMLFSRVLSPAHDLPRLVDGPLVASLQQRRPAVLVVGLPGAEADPTTSRGDRDKIRGCCAVAMDLYAPLLQLLFQNLPECVAATCSVVTASASDRWLYDGIQGKRVRTLEEVEWVTIDRAASFNDGFGALLACLVQRHDGLQEEADSLSSETACVVTVQLEPYAPLVITDVGSDQDVLQQLTLILGMCGACGRRTYPPRSSPLVSLLQEYVVPEATLHVVVVPEPSSAPRHAMRLLRFASGLEAHRQESLVLSSTAAAAGDQSASASSVESPGVRPAARATRPAPAKTTAPRVAVLSSTTSGRRVSQDGAHAAQQRAATAALSADIRSVPLEQPPSSAEATMAAVCEAVPVAGVSPLTPSNEHLLNLRIRSLEAALEDVKNAYTREHTSRVRLEAQLDAVHTESDMQRTQFATKTREMEKLRADNVEFAELVPRLMKKVSGLEKAKASWETQRKTLTHDKDVAQQRVAELQTLVTRFTKQRAQQEHQRALLARERTLYGVLGNVADIAGHNSRLVHDDDAKKPKQQRRTASSSQQARGHIVRRADSTDGSRGVDDDSDNDNDDDDDDRDGGRGEGGQQSAQGSGRAQSRRQLERLHAITVDELRRRNLSLEKEVASLRAHTDRNPREPLQTSVAPGDMAENAPFLRERLEYFMTELSHARQEKDSLIRYILEHRARLSQPLPHEVRSHASAADEDDDEQGDPMTAARNRKPPMRPRFEDTDGNIHSYREPSKPQPAPSSSSSPSQMQETLREETSPPADALCPICAVVSSLQAGCTALVTVHDEMLAEVERDPERTSANGLTAAMLQEHAHATKALQRALSETANRTVYGIQHCPHTINRPLPAVASIGNGATLSEVLSFESERAARLASFVPSFTQLAVATENMLMRVPRPPA